MIDLQSKEILQINATIIAGTLIFLTLLGSSPNLKSIAAPPLVLVIALIILMFFSASSFIVILGRKEDAIGLIKYGFLLIFIFAIIILLAFGIKEISGGIRSFFFETTNQNITNQNTTNQSIANQSR